MIGKFGWQQIRPDHLVLGRHRSYDDRFAVFRDALEALDTGEIYQMFRRRHAQLHHWDQAVASGKGPGFIAVFGQDRHCFFDSRWPVICEFTWDHVFLLPHAAKSVGRWSETRTSPCV
jgi:hypothetical protein